MSGGDNQALSATLKEEGNALFIRKEYQAAHAKYSQALDLDNSNAVLYANRAACSQHLRKYVTIIGLGIVLPVIIHCTVSHDTERDVIFLDTWMPRPTL